MVSWRSSQEVLFMRVFSSLAAVLVVGASLAGAPAQAQVTKEQVPGITNFARVETTVACAGAIKPEAVSELKQMGFKSVINLRLATEDGANVEDEAAAAKAAGVNYVHLPFSGQSPDPAVVDAFLTAITVPENNPAFIHCAGGNRAATMWFIKRVQIDGWAIDRASEEAAGLGLTGAPMKQFALNYIQTHKK
jgi:uncharacterized protein (TIGR01244 family)